MKTFNNFGMEVDWVAHRVYRRAIRWIPAKRLRQKTVQKRLTEIVGRILSRRTALDISLRRGGRLVVIAERSVRHLGIRPILERPALIPVA